MTEQIIEQIIETMNLDRFACKNKGTYIEGSSFLYYKFPGAELDELENVLYSVGLESHTLPGQRLLFVPIGTKVYPPVVEV